MPVINATRDELNWLLPGSQPSPVEAIARIGALCAAHEDGYTALFTVLATHTGVPKERIAVAIKQFRREFDDLSANDVAGLLTSIWNGGKCGYEATLRSRRKGERGGVAALPWGPG